MQSELGESDLEDYGNPQGKIQGKVFSSSTMAMLRLRNIIPRVSETVVGAPAGFVYAFLV